jgi:hypothetical protein
MSEFSNLTTNSKVFPAVTNSDFLKRKKIFYTITFTKKKNQSWQGKDGSIFPAYLLKLIFKSHVLRKG